MQRRTTCLILFVFAVMMTACTGFPLRPQGRLRIAVSWPQRLQAQMIPPETRAFGIRVVTANGHDEIVLTPESRETTFPEMPTGEVTVYVIAYDEDARPVAGASATAVVVANDTTDAGIELKAGMPAFVGQLQSLSAAVAARLGKPKPAADGSIAPSPSPRPDGPSPSDGTASPSPVPNHSGVPSSDGSPSPQAGPTNALSASSVPSPDPPAISNGSPTPSPMHSPSDPPPEVAASPA
ncbi:MAG: hypothetical protein H7338_14535 [Candidatus Sericytochromatia bacterium]|nr:hypothetical protein [Candidatus Sericytochromatia bacterium]